jgi:hypothetical protein
MDAHDVRRIAVEALVDPRTVRKYLDGHPVAKLTVRRIESAARRLGLVLDAGRTRADKEA